MSLYCTARGGWWADALLRIGLALSCFAPYTLKRLCLWEKIDLGGWAVACWTSYCHFFHSDGALLDAMRHEMDVEDDRG